MEQYILNEQESFIEILWQHDQNVDKTIVIDYIFQEINEYLKQAQFEFVREILWKLANILPKFSSDVLQSFITICFPASKFLGFKFIYYSIKAEEKMKERGDKAIIDWNFYEGLI